MTNPNADFYSKNVSRETFDRLKAYEALLVKWQASINLIGRSTASDIWLRHFAESIWLGQVVLPKIFEKINGQNPDSIFQKSIIDMGSGAGFPGMVLAVMGYKNICLIESDERKAAFLHTVKTSLGVSVAILNQRIENANNSLPHTPDVITARALSPLDQLCDYAECLSGQDTIYCFYKGARYAEEIDAANGHLVRKRKSHCVIPMFSDFSQNKASFPDTDSAMIVIGNDNKIDHLRGYTN